MGFLSPALLHASQIQFSWIHFLFSEMALSPLSLFFLSRQGERDLPEVSRRDLDLLIAEEDAAILLEEQGRPIQ